MVNQHTHTAQHDSRPCENVDSETVDTETEDCDETYMRTSSKEPSTETNVRQHKITLHLCVFSFVFFSLPCPPFFTICGLSIRHCFFVAFSLFGSLPCSLL